MATVTTKAGQVEDALVAQLQARVGLAGVQVDIGPLGDSSARGEWIQFGVGESAALSGAQEWGSLGNKRKDERVSITGRVFVASSGTGTNRLRDARDRALELMAEVEEQLRDDPKIDGLVVQAALTSWQHTRYADAGVIDFTIEYLAWLPRT
jgi:hypothetical protein